MEAQTRLLNARLVTAPLNLRSVPQDVARHYLAWVASFADERNHKDRWVPVGRLGPLIILGHFAPSLAPTPAIPSWAFGFCQIPEPVYRAVLRDLTDVENAATCTESDSLVRLAPPSSSDSPAQILSVLVQLPASDSEVETAKNALAEASGGDGGWLNKLPPGWAEAVTAVQTESPIVDLSALAIDPAVAALVPEGFASEFGLCPLAVDGLNICVATHLAGGPEASRITSAWKGVRSGAAERYRLRLAVAVRMGRAEVESRITRAKKPHGASTTAPWGSASPGGKSSAVTVSNQTVKWRLTKEECSKYSVGTAGMNDELLLRVGLFQAISLGASDLHIDYAAGQGRMRVRHDGSMRPLGSGCFELKRLITILNLLRVGIDAKGGVMEAADGKFSLKCDDAYFDVRVSILPAPDAAESQLGYATLRFLPKDTNVRSLVDLQLGRDEHDGLMEMIEKPHGIILVTGPTGSGKTTTLNALVQTLNRGIRVGEEAALKIMTVEDPVEYVIDGIQQVNASSKLTFAEAIRRFLRHDPDVILVGEIRDTETALAAISAARSGHLVLSTLHTNGAAETVARLRNLGIPAYDLDGPLVGMIAQRLIRRLCTNCKTPTPPSPGVLQRIAAAGVKCPEMLYTSSPSGCPHCDRGWKGRIPILEIVKVTQPIRDAIANGVSENELKKVCRIQGFKSLTDQALVKVAAGVTSFDEATGLESEWH